MSSIEAIRQLVPAETVVRRAFSTRIRALDDLLGQGVESGRTIEWVGAYSCGKTGVLRTVVRAIRRQGTAVAWIDTAGEQFRTPGL